MQYNNAERVGMAHKISVDDVEERDRDGDLRFSEKSYQKVSNPDSEEKVADFDENELGVAEENEKGKGPHLVKGKRRKKTVGRERKYSRTGCKAFLSIKPHRDTGKFKVSRFSTIHNHELVDIFEGHFLRSHRKVTLQDILEVKALHEADVNTSDAFNYLAQQSGGRAFVGFMLKDLYTKLHNYKQLNSQYGDAEAAMNWLRIRGSEEEIFFCRYIRDSKKRLARLFWRDSHSLMDYELYGDVLVIDATYKTNVYVMPLVLFIGANNHRATVVFACTLICNEKEGTYDWVVKNFLEAMNNQKPKSVVTDGADSMRKSLDTHMPQTKHRLCAWHIGRNVGQNVKDEKLQKALGKMIYTSYSRDEWEREWGKMVREHNVEENTWIQSLHNKRKKWAEAYCRGHWYAGICSTQRCEGMNCTIKLKVGKSTTLIEFVPRYQRGISRLRDRVLLDNFKSKNHSREYVSHLVCMEEFVFETFTEDIYLVIRNQMDFEKIFRVTSRIPDPFSDNLMIYVTQYDKADRCWAVQFIARNSEKSQDESYSCSCELFESDNIPCAHILCAMKNEGVFVYMKSLICERWKKSCGSRPLDKTSVQVQVIRFAPCRYLSLIAAAKRACYNFAQSAEGFKEGMVALAKLEEHSFEFRAKKKPRLIVEDNSNVVLDPIVARTNGKHCNAKNGLQPNGTKVKACGHCRVPGHNLRTCPELQSDDNGK
ncbi:protein FAR1-RELATED SEQUENCE 5-like [Argentina anserina]|uniref:protein FAR1-RELATED SEQUENCE 5-like n=1 Tax=Argentina anserina TaxID=57926 RepID=UPI0021765CFB|nr:protein FAR1-RELATED SEQUENCE 5-like [Potentilla anserina]